MGAFLPGICNCVRAEGQVSSLLKIIGSWQALRDCGWVGDWATQAALQLRLGYTALIIQAVCVLLIFLIIEDLFLMVYSLSSKFPQKERNKRNLIKKKGT